MVKTTLIRVMIVDDHDLLRLGLKLLLQACDDIELVGEARSGVEAVEHCRRKHPDVLLMDLVMPDMNGVEACRTIRQDLPETQVVILTSFADEKLVHAALQAGAISYILKNASPQELLDTIRAAYRGQPTLAHEATQALISVSAPSSISQSQLTRREQEVLNLMSQGLTNLEIAKQLTVTHSTVKKHVSNILSKLQSSTRTEAVAFALQHHLTGR